MRDVAAWKRWLGRHHAQQAHGVWLVLAKKGSTEPTSLTYAQALEESLCFGWIDGQLKTRDGATYMQRFTPRRARSQWSSRNVAAAEQLIAAGRMQPAGLAEVTRAKADGRWQRAYDGAATIEVPDDLAAALRANTAAATTFAQLSRQNRFAILYRITTVSRASTRARKIAQYVDMLARGETI